MEALLQRKPGPDVTSDFDHVSDWIGHITRVWARGAGSTLELAQVVWMARKRLPYGQWAQALRAVPFSKRKANMLATIGKGLAWLDGQTFAHLPLGWSILYQLAQLDRIAIEKLIQEGAIHPKLSLWQARLLLARFKGQHNNNESRRTNVKQRLQRFVDFVRNTVHTWQPEE